MDILSILFTCRPEIITVIILMPKNITKNVIQISINDKVNLILKRNKLDIIKNIKNEVLITNKTAFITLIVICFILYPYVFIKAIL